MAQKRVLILGCTGSIGTQTIETTDHLNALHAAGRWPHSYTIVGLVAGRNTELLARQAQQCKVTNLGLGRAAGKADLVGQLGSQAARCTIRTGPDAAEQLVREVEADIVVAAMVGAAGIPATLAAAALGRQIALANKETLVAAGELIVPVCRRTGATLLPVDSEHSAVWQCLAGSHTTEGAVAGAAPLNAGPEVQRVILTASGGALRHLSKADAYNATPEMALKHPTWSMGAKVTIDSASLTNKAFEIIEAHWLFGLEPERIGVLIHPQSIVHSLVEYADGSAIAQLSPPDMRLPIQVALCWPHRGDGVARRMDWAALRTLEFSLPEPGRFAALDAADTVMRRAGTSGATFNAASEVATEAFLAKRIPFGRMGEVVMRAMSELGHSPVRDLADVLAADAEARRWTAGAIQ